jgi:hypothetical protein
LNQWKVGLRPQAGAERIELRLPPGDIHWAVEQRAAGDNEKAVTVVDLDLAVVVRPNETTVGSQRDDCGMRRLE